ncbi:MAG: radical SAM protein [Candidatus Cloacimonetes bacterium]|nr:radical SAM protein [Candidatus Cloacimonadota bacterium]
MRLLKQCHSSLLSEWAKNVTTPENLPWLCYISVTNHCNNRCAVCAREKTMRPERGTMSMELFKRIVEQLPDTIKKVYLFKQGEPLIHPKLEEMAEYLRQKRPSMFISIHTNGILATKERVSRLFNSIDSLAISISATDAESYRNVHRTDNFEVVTQNLRDISALRLALPPDKRPHVFIDYVYQEANSHVSEEEAVEFFKSNFPGLSSIDFHWVFNFQGEIEQGNMDIYDKLPISDFPTCVWPWAAVTFLHDGKLSYCFVEPKENVFLGDITTHNFTEIWQGETWSHFRECQADKAFDTLEEEGYGCRKCSWLWSMKSQSPKNLSVGYTLSHSVGKQWDIGDTLDQSPEKILERAAALYQIGEIQQALGFSVLLEQIAPDGELLKSARELTVLCNQVLAKYNKIPLWKKTMADEGIESEDKQCRYYEIEEKK